MSGLVKKPDPMQVQEARPGQSPDAASGRAPTGPAAGGANQSADKLQSSLGIMADRKPRKHGGKDDCEP